MHMIYAILYVVSLVLFSSSMCNPARPYMEFILPLLILSTVLFGRALYRRIYR